MKTFIKITILAIAVLMVIPSVYAQKTNKELKKELKAKADKESRKSAKELKKTGWKVMPGKLSLEKQIQAAKYAELDINDEGDKRYFIGTHQATGGNYTAAKQIADNRARVELAQSVNTAVSQKIEEQVANTDYGDGDIQLIDEFISANKSIVTAQLQGVNPILEIYRETKNNQYEVQVLVSIETDKALKQAKRALYNELKSKSNKLAEDLDRILPD